MRKTIIAVVIVGMFGWAIYDYVSKSDSGSNVEESFIIEESSGMNDPEEEGDSDIVGLMKGNIAPNFELETLDGDRVALNDFRGERVMLNFWATWCPPCRAEIPDMQRFYEDKKDEGIEILAVNLIDSRPDEADNVGPYVEDEELTFPILLDKESEVSQGLYNIQPIPTSFLIDSKGIINFVAYGPLNYDLLVQQFADME